MTKLYKTTNHALKIGLAILGLFGVKQTFAQTAGAGSNIFRVTEMAPGSNDLSPESALFYNDKIIFSGEDNVFGRELSELDINGEIVEEHKIESRNIDWEAISGDDEYFYIGDIGNNNGKRKHVNIIQVSKENFNIRNIKVKYENNDDPDMINSYKLLKANQCIDEKSDSVNTYKNAAIVGVILGIAVVFFSSELQSFFKTTSSNMFVVFGIDAGITVFYKIILRENIFVPHRDFLFKKLVHIAKMKHLNVSASYAMVQLIIGLATVLFFRNIPKSTQIAVLFTSIVGLIGVYIFYRNKLTRKKHEKPINRDGKLTTTYKRIS